MLARFKEVCDTVLTYRDHKDRLVRKNVIQVRRAALALSGEHRTSLYSTTLLPLCITYFIDI
jgi:hypothetical protein